MLPKSFRLSRREFLSAKSSGKSHSFPHFSVLSSPHTPGRTAVVTSAKLSKSAVIRNQLRRQIYSCIPKANYDVIIFPKPSMLKLTRGQITFELNSLVSKISH